MARPTTEVPAATAPDPAWAIRERATRTRRGSIGLVVGLSLVLIGLSLTFAASPSVPGSGTRVWLSGMILLVAAPFVMLGFFLYYLRCPVCGWWTRFFYRHCPWCGARLRP